MVVVVPSDAVDITGIPQRTVDRVVALAGRMVTSVEQGVGHLGDISGHLGDVVTKLGTTHTDNRALVKALEHLEKTLVATIDDFGSAKGALADAVGGLATTVGNLDADLSAALDRVQAKLGSMAAAQAAQITPEDVAALQAEVAKIQGASSGLGDLSTRLKGVASDPGNTVPPDAPALDVAPGDSAPSETPAPGDTPQARGSHRSR